MLYFLDHLRILTCFIHISSPVYISQLLNHLQHSLMPTLNLTSPSSFVNKSLVIYDIEFFYNKNRCSISGYGCFSLNRQSEGFGCNKRSKFIIIIYIIVPSSHNSTQPSAIYYSCIQYLYNVKQVNRISKMTGTT